MIHTKFSDFVNESLSNLSKNRTWPTVDGHTDTFFVYDLPKDKIGEYLNTWFVGNKTENKATRKGHARVMDEVITLKEMDLATVSHLYGRKFNPISIFIKTDYQNRELFQMKLTICSIDDSSYGIWWSGTDFSKLESIRNQLMKHINGLSIVNGEQLLDFCVTLGADEASKDYN